MSTLELKNEFHSLIDKIEDAAILEQFFYIMEDAVNHPTSTTLWDGLSDGQREELLLSIEESKDPENLIPHEEMKKKHSKWL